MIMGITSWLYFENFPLAVPSLVPAVLISGMGMIVGSLFLKHPKVLISRHSGIYFSCPRQNSSFEVVEVIQLVIFFKPLNNLSASATTSAVDDNFFLPC
jgi:hypothetical protein